jgi:hypothetical protein
MARILGSPGHPTGRLIAWTPVRTTNPHAGAALINALPGAHRVPAFHGYDPLVENTPPHMAAAYWLEESPLRVARAYGLRWHLTIRGLGPVRAVSDDLYTMEGRPPYEKAFAALRPLTLRPVFESGPILLTELDDVDPLAFVEGRPDRPLPLRIHAAGIEVDVGSAGGETVMVNFLWRPQMQASVDGVPVSCEHDDLLRMRVRVPRGGEKLEVRYEPNWMTGMLLGCAAIGLAIMLNRRLHGAAATTSCSTEAGSRPHSAR